MGARVEKKAEKVSRWAFSIREMDREEVGACGRKGDPVVRDCRVGRW